MIQGAFIRKLNNEARNAQHTVKVELAFPATLLKEKWVLLVQGLHHNSPQKCVLLIWPPDDQSNRPRLPRARGFLWIQTRGEMNRAGAREGRRCQTMLRCHSPEQSCLCTNALCPLPTTLNCGVIKYSPYGIERMSSQLTDTQPNFKNVKDSNNFSITPTCSDRCCCEARKSPFLTLDKNSSYSYPLPIYNLPQIKTIARADSCPGAFCTDFIMEGIKQNCTSSFGSKAQSLSLDV